MFAYVAEASRSPTSPIVVPRRPPKPKLRASLKAVDQATVANRIVLRGELAGDGAVIALEVLTQFMGLQSTDQPLQLDLRHIESPDEFGFEVLSHCLGRITAHSRHVTLLLRHYPKPSQLTLEIVQLFLGGRGFPTTECLLAAETHRVLLVAPRPKPRRQWAPRAIMAPLPSAWPLSAEPSTPIPHPEDQRDSL